jgi:hypothetical protein
MRAASAYCSPSSNNSATSHDRAAPVNSAAVIAATAAILVSRVTIAAAIIGAAAGYDGSAANNGPPTNDRSPAIGGTATNCATSVNGPSSAAAAGPDLQDFTIVSLTIVLNLVSRGDISEVFRKNRNGGSHCRRGKQGRTGEHRSG